MFSAIAAFLWGTSSAAVPSPSLAPEEPLPVGVNSIKDDVFSDAITHEGVDEVSPAAVDGILSTSSLSDEEAGWVFVNSKKRGSAGSKTPEEKPAEPIKLDPVFLKDPAFLKDGIKSLPQNNNNNNININNNKNTNNTNAPATRSRNIPNSALQAANVLATLEELRPQQKSERRQKERHLKRKQLERANKVAQVESSSNQPSKRRAMYSSAVFSRAVNNRKC